MKARELAAKLMEDPEAEVFIIDEFSSEAAPVQAVCTIDQVEELREVECVGGAETAALILVADQNPVTTIQFDETGHEDEDGDEDEDEGGQS